MMSFCTTSKQSSATGGLPTVDLCQNSGVEKALRHLQQEHYYHQRLKINKEKTSERCLEPNALKKFKIFIYNVKCMYTSSGSL